MGCFSSSGALRFEVLLCLCAIVVVVLCIGDVVMDVVYGNVCVG